MTDKELKQLEELLDEYQNTVNEYQRLTEKEYRKFTKITCILFGLSFVMFAVHMLMGLE